MQGASKNYSRYATTDFILDEDFVRWVQDPLARDIAFWEQWQAQHPQQQKDITDARRMVTGLKIKTDYNDPVNVEQTWDILSEHFDQNSGAKRFLLLPVRSFLRIAAVFAILAFTCTFVWFRLSQKTTSNSYKTGYGQVSKIMLSDSSEVTLNANSSLKVVFKSGLHPTREAWLTGEAFFHVKRQPVPQQFTVHTHNVNVQVLGTEFNVYNRHNASAVVLSSGKIRINNVKVPESELIMKPGTLAIVADTSRTFLVKMVDPENHLAWIHQKLVFEHTPIKDVAHVLEDTYGVSVVISKATLANKTFSATLPSNNLPILLKAIEESFNVNIRQQDKKLFITDK